MARPRYGIGVQPCCCEFPCEPRDWEFDWEGFLEGNPWTVNPGDEWDVICNLEDSWEIECGGLNQNTQIAEAQKCFTLRETTEITVELLGRIEQQNAGYDLCRVEFLPLHSQDPIFTVASDVSDKEGGLCVMEDRSKTASRTLERGAYRIIITVDTVDERWHKDAYWNVRIRGIPDR